MTLTVSFVHNGKVAWKFELTGDEISQALFPAVGDVVRLPDYTERVKDSLVRVRDTTLVYIDEENQQYVLDVQEL